MREVGDLQVVNTTQEDGIKQEPKVKEENLQQEEYFDEELTDSAAEDDKDFHPDDASDEEEKEDWKPTKDEIDEEKREKKVRKKRTPRQTAPGKDGEQRTKRPYVRGGKKNKRDPNVPHRSDFKCYICSSDSLGSAEALLAHLHGHEDQLPYKCSECVMEEVEIKVVTTLNLHKKMHLNRYKCTLCDKRYSTPKNVQMHIEMNHEVQEPATCDQCGKLCPSKFSLREHMKLHTASPCEFCGKVFKEKHKLKRHIERKHTGKKYECYICNKKLCSLDAVQLHISIMHSNKEVKCDVCSKVYTSEVSLKNHMKKHEQNPNWEPSTRNWQEYYTVVEGEEGLKDGVRLKKCKLCGEVKRAIATHLQMVHFPTEHRCDICGATFKRKDAFEVHVLEHTNGKAYKCPICGKEFSEKKNLFSHLKTKKHQDHPLAKSLDWFVDVHAGRDRRRETDVAVNAINHENSEDVIVEVNIEHDRIM